MTTETKKHTPGPWAYEDPMGPDILSIVANPDAEPAEWVHIAQIGTGDSDVASFAENVANAHLIAAAPDLLAACQALVALAEANLCKPAHPTEGWDAYVPTEVTQARAAIAKAGGQE